MVKGGGGGVDSEVASRGVGIGMGVVRRDGGGGVRVRRGGRRGGRRGRDGRVAVGFRGVANSIDISP